MLQDSFSSRISLEVEHAKDSKDDLEVVDLCDCREMTIKIRHILG